MKKWIVAALLFLILFSSPLFAANPDGKLYIFSSDSLDTIYVDGLLIGKGKVWVEALEEGDYTVQAHDQAGNIIYDKKVKVKGHETMTVEIGKADQIAGQPAVAAEKKKPPVEYTPTFTVYIGYHFLRVSGNFSSVGDVHDADMRGNLAGLEINKNLTDVLEVQLGVMSCGGTLPPSSSYVAVSPVYLNLRYVWESNNWFRVNYVGFGENLASWTEQGTGSGSGYQLFVGGYTDSWGHLGALQTELGFMSLSGTGAAKTAQGLYLKAGWAF